ncbi:DUF6455 family protein [Shimia sp. Alg240-R146]|uniref:DUF6455 family protein n=1 Tax=Shimia sp. Alg240-R146 TaxID=2993449 RepID=UPI0022E43F3B|nr:DUF6455 family protein [Shimia sp. Alg240-R146]
MKPLGDVNEHLMKVHGMAKAAGADLVSAAKTGELTQEEWAGIVTRCRSCDWDEGCARFLTRGCRETPVEIPEACLNRVRLAELAAATGGDA